MTGASADPQVCVHQGWSRNGIGMRAPSSQRRLRPAAPKGIRMRTRIRQATSQQLDIRKPEVVSGCTME